MIGVPRGRILSLGGAPEVTGAVVSASTVDDWRKIAALAVTLPLFAGLFFYVVDAPPLYALAKVWPVLTAPLAVFAAWRLRPAFQSLILVACAWLLGASALIGVGQMGNDVVGAVAAGVKIWPLTGALSAAAILWRLGPSDDDIHWAVVLLALLTFGFLVGAWFVSPDAAFEQTIETTKVFLSDPERGRRINAPMMFGILGLFLLNRSFWSRPAFWKAVLIGLGLIAMLTIYKQRAQIGGTFLLLVFGALMSLGRFRNPAMAVAVAIVLAAIVPASLWLQSGAADSLGGSLTMRQTEAEAALRFLNDQPWRWITGVGSATRVGEVTMGDIVGTPFFFPSDLGWLGVVFEYGAVGAGLMLALHLLAIRMAWEAARGP